jgi:hypothetical protein
MEEPKTELHFETAFSTDVVAVYKIYEQALRIVDCDRLPLRVGRAIRGKIKMDISTFRDSSAEFLTKALEQLGFQKAKLSPEATDLIRSIFETIDQFGNADELISIVVGIEENLAITRSLLRTWALENLKHRNNYHQYRNSNLKLFFNLTQNLPVLEELRELETDEGISSSNEATTKLTTLFFEWWKIYYSPEKIEQSLT